MAQRGLCFFDTLADYTVIPHLEYLSVEIRVNRHQTTVYDATYTTEYQVGPFR